MNHAIKVSKTFIVGLFSLVFSALSLVMLGKPLKGKLFLGSLQNFLNGEETFYYLNDDEKFCPPNLKKISGKRLRYAECFIDKTKTKNRTIFFSWR